MLKRIVTLLAVTGLVAPALAQTGSAATGRGGLLGGLLGGGIPSIGSVGAGNAAGLLGYCIQNNLLGGLAGQAATGAAPSGTSATGAAATGTAGTRTGAAQSILQRLTGRQGVTTSPGYQAGQAGQVQTPGGQTLSLDGLRGQVKNQVCGLVLNRARSFL